MFLQKHESYRYEHWKNWVGYVSTRREKMLLYETCTFWRFWKFKKMTFLHIMTTFHIFALKIEIGWVARVVKAIWETKC